MLKIVFATLITAAPLAALGQTSPPPLPSASASSPASPSAAPTASPTPVASPSATPTTSPSPLPTPLVLPPEAAPQILAVAFNEQVYHSGDVFWARVITSTNVPAVELR